MKINVALLVSLSVLAAGAFVSPARAESVSDRPTNGPAILAQRSERNAQNRAQNPDARRFGTPIAGRNYIGLGGSTDGAVINGKYALSNRFSVRPEVITEVNNDDGDRNVAILAPITYDFSGIGNDRFQPFIGAGVGVTTGDETDFELVATAGADYQVGKRYAINGSVNYMPLGDEQEVDFVAGVGYRF